MYGSRNNLLNAYFLAIKALSLQELIWYSSEWVPRQKSYLFMPYTLFLQTTFLYIFHVSSLSCIPTFCSLISYRVFLSNTCILSIFVYFPCYLISSNSLHMTRPSMGAALITSTNPRLVWKFSVITHICANLLGMIAEGWVYMNNIIKKEYIYITYSNTTSQLVLPSKLIKTIAQAVNSIVFIIYRYCLTWIEK